MWGVWTRRVWSHETPHQQILTQDFFDARMISRTRSRLLSCDTRVWYLSLVWVCSASGSRTHRILRTLLVRTPRFDSIAKNISCLFSISRQHRSWLRVDSPIRLAVRFFAPRLSALRAWFLGLFWSLFGGLKRGRKMVIFWCFFGSHHVTHVIEVSLLSVIKLFLIINIIIMCHRRHWSRKKVEKWRFLDVFQTLKKGLKIDVFWLFLTSLKTLEKSRQKCSRHTFFTKLIDF